MVLLQQSALVNDRLRIDDLAPNVDSHLFPPALVDRIDDEGISDSRLEQLQEANCASDIDVLDGEGADLQ